MMLPEGGSSVFLFQI